MGNWYNNPTVSTEMAILADDIKFNYIQDIEAEFILPVFTPTIDTSAGNAMYAKMRAPSMKSQKGRNTITASEYTANNTLTLKIPAYIVQHFFNPFYGICYIPKGTKFTVSGLGQKTDADKIRITGFYKVNPDDDEDE